ncbi:MAG: GyrI-like domain-containing protein [Leptolyngbyaceae cyanobacterium bins.302]|nr:GyrI-like domain-containing protein [Leptolyngbyaceae cyanobacterium bins.302]
MVPQLRTHKGMKFIGVEAKTSSQLESNKKTAQIPGLHRKFLKEGLEEKIPNRIDSDLYFAVYTNYESDQTGTYSFILSAEVSNSDEVPDGMVAIDIPTAQYLVFTVKGSLPHALTRTWKEIWNYFANNKVYQRAYTADFEVYDKSFPDLVEVYIAIQK